MISAARRADVDVVDLDPHSPHVVAHRDAVCAALRARERITWSTAHGGLAVAARDDDVRTVLLGPATFSSGVPGRVAVPPTDGEPAAARTLEVDPPRHDEQVALVSRWFSRSAVDVHETDLRTTAASLLHGRARPCATAGGRAQRRHPGVRRRAPAHRLTAASRRTRNRSPKQASRSRS